MFDAARLREILEDDLGCDLDGVTDETLLFSAGIVDSFALVTLMMHLEKEAGIAISPAEVTLENFDSIARILAFVGRAQG
jgi:acyl carrier protein